MPPSTQERLTALREGSDPALICRMPSGWVTLCSMQFLRGYCILLSDTLAASLNDLAVEQRAQFLVDMSRVGDALIEVTSAYRINYAIMGNSEPVLHAHIVPRYDWEEERYRRGLPWSYPQALIDSQRFDPARDHALIEQVAHAIARGAPRSL